MHIYFSGIGGVAIGPLALICRDAGYEISGSDLAISPMTTALQKAGVKLKIGQDGSQIASTHTKQPVDWLVISSALPPDHPEIIFAKKHDIRISKRAEMINIILEEKHLKLVAVAGTHGKTTTTAMLVWLFKQFGIPVSYSIGTTLSFGPSGAYQTKSEYFLYECDEYDRNMLSFHPYLSLLTTVGYDHPDTYPLPSEYDNAFRQFVGQSTEVIAWQSDQLRLKLEHYHLGVLNDDDSHITQIKLVGLHYRQNAWQAANAFCQLFPTIPLYNIMSCLNTFPGTARRFEKLSVGVYSTYSHHPTEIRADLQMARELSNDVIAIYQPHQNIRQFKIIDDYQDCFETARHVYWLPTYLSREDSSLEVLTPAQIIEHLHDPSIAEPAEMNTALVQKLQEHRKRGALLLFMGAGSIDDWARQHFWHINN